MNYQHIARKHHTMQRLHERYGVMCTDNEYEELCQIAIHAPQIKHTAISEVSFKGLKIYCVIRKGEIATVLDSSIVSRKVRYQDSLQPKTKPLINIGTFFKS